MGKKFDSGSIYGFCEFQNKKRRSNALKQRVLGRNEEGDDGGECEGADWAGESDYRVPVAIRF